METQGQHPSIDILRTFSPLKDISREQLNKLALEKEVIQAPAGARLITLGSQDNPPIYLIDGALRLTAEDGRIKEIRSGDSSSRIPVSQLIPHRYEVTALTPVRYMGISPNRLQEIKQDSVPQRNTLPGYAVSDEDQEEAQETSQLENHISYQFLQDLENDLLVLPSLPDVATRISQAVRDDESDARKIADIVQTDPVITAKLIKAANSALYSGQH
ncbi:MAG: HDOD domain-containing protein, partial [Gammaproteobacteria bacterium]|nr:HDOD domain-containing protein [Gammaproteobacteria bacterium]